MNSILLFAEGITCFVEKTMGSEFFMAFIPSFAILGHTSKLLKFGKNT